jgi:hypothetical protein
MWMLRRRGREAEGGGLLNRYTAKSRIEGSNPSVSANSRFHLISDAYRMLVPEVLAGLQGPFNSLSN